MREKISALVDGELDEQETERLLRRVGQDETLARVWQRYHLMRAVIRNESIYYEPDLAQRIAEAIDSELATPPAAGHGRWRSSAPSRWLPGMALAASLAVVTIGSTLALRSTDDTSLNPPADVTRIAATERATRWDGADPELEETLNGFLVEHGEFTTASGMNGLISYAKFVSYDSSK